jgi:hypothetical protein
MGSEGRSGDLRRWTSGELAQAERRDPAGHKNPQRGVEAGEASRGSGPERIR